MGEDQRHPNHGEHGARRVCLAYGLKTDPTKLRFSPTAIALGSSAIVKLSGQNCFRTLYGSLGQIRLGPPKGSGGQVPPRFHQRSRSFVASLLLRGRSVLRCQKVPPKVSPRSHQGCGSFADLSGLLGEVRFGAPKGSVEGSPITSLTCLPVPQLFLAFSLTALVLGSSAIVKVWGQNATFLFWGFLQQMVFASQKVLGSVPQTVFYIGLTVSCGFWVNGCCFRKGFVDGSANYSLHLSPKWLLLQTSSSEGSANCALHLSPSLLLGSKMPEVLTCLTHTNPVRRKPPIMLLLLGYSLGLFQKVKNRPSYATDGLGWGGVNSLNLQTWWMLRS